MNLHEHLTDTLDRIDETGPDVTRLTTVARRRGTAARRRRAVAVVATASVAVLGLTGAVVAAVSGPDGTRDADVATDPVTPDLDGPTLPTTAEGAVLALQWAVDEQRTGSVTDLAGQLGSTSGDHYVEFTWRDADGLGESLVGLNVQHGRGMHATCDDPEQLSCTRTTLPDGSELTTYEYRGTHGEWRRYADLFRADRIRVVASSANGDDVVGGPWQVTRPAPPLSTDDLVSIVRQQIWGDRLPEAFVEAGNDLDDYEDIDDPRGWIHGDVD